MLAIEDLRYFSALAALRYQSKHDQRYKNNKDNRAGRHDWQNVIPQADEGWEDTSPVVLPTSPANSPDNPFKVDPTLFQIVKRYRKLPGELQDNVQEGYYSAHMWIIEAGPAFYSTDFILELENRLSSKIRKVTMKFTLEDYLQGSSWDYCLFGPCPREVGDLVEEINHLREQAIVVGNDLCHVWWEKFYYITGLQLDQLTLDFSEAYTLDREYLGEKLARTLSAFDHGLPSDIEILTPPNQSRDDILDILREKNP